MLNLFRLPAVGRVNYSARGFSILWHCFTSYRFYCRLIVILSVYRVFGENTKKLPILYSYSVSALTIPTNSNELHNVLEFMLILFFFVFSRVSVRSPANDFDPKPADRSLHRAIADARVLVRGVSHVDQLLDPRGRRDHCSR